MDGGSSSTSSSSTSSDSSIGGVGAWTSHHSDSGHHSDALHRGDAASHGHADAPKATDHPASGSATTADLHAYMASEKEGGGLSGHGGNAHGEKAHAEKAHGHGHPSAHHGGHDSHGPTGGHDVPAKAEVNAPAADAIPATIAINQTVAAIANHPEVPIPVTNPDGKTSFIGVSATDLPGDSQRVSVGDFTFIVPDKNAADTVVTVVQYTPDHGADQTGKIVVSSPGPVAIENAPDHDHNTGATFTVQVVEIHPGKSEHQSDKPHDDGKHHGHSHHGHSHGHGHGHHGDGHGSHTHASDSHTSSGAEHGGAVGVAGGHTSGSDTHATGSGGARGGDGAHGGDGASGGDGTGGSGESPGAGGHESPTPASESAGPGDQAGAGHHGPTDPGTGHTAADLARAYEAGREQAANAVAGLQRHDATEQINAAHREANNPDNSPVVRAMFEGLAVAAKPAGYLQEHVVNPVLRAPADALEAQRHAADAARHAVHGDGKAAIAEVGRADAKTKEAVNAVAAVLPLEGMAGEAVAGAIGREGERSALESTLEKRAGEIHAKISEAARMGYDLKEATPAIAFNTIGMVSVAEVKIAGETHTLVGVKVPTGAMDHNTAVRGPDFFDPSAVGAWLTEHVLAPHETLAGVTVTQHSEGPVVSAIKAAAEAAGVHPDTVTGTIGSKTAICGPCQEMIEKAVAAVVMENPVPVPVKPPR